MPLSLNNTVVFNTSGSGATLYFYNEGVYMNVPLPPQIKTIPINGVFNKVVPMPGVAYAYLGGSYNLGGYAIFSIDPISGQASLGGYVLSPIHVVLTDKAEIEAYVKSVHETIAESHKHQ
jgi:hypothetical protein